MATTFCAFARNNFLLGISSSKTFLRQSQVFRTNFLCPLVISSEHYCVGIIHDSLPKMPQNRQEKLSKSMLTENKSFHRSFLTEALPGRSPIREINLANVESILAKYDTFLFDCDGVLWSGNHFKRFRRTGEALSKLRNLDKSVLFVTNNTWHCRCSLAERLRAAIDYEADTEEIFCVAYASALYLKNVLNLVDKEKCYIVGTQGMKAEFELAGVSHIGFGPDPDPISDLPRVLVQEHRMDREVRAVVVGCDPNFSYNKLYKAASYLIDPACHYLASSDLEKSVLLDPTHRQPLTGSLVECISSAAGREPIVIGKPSTIFFDCVLASRPSLDRSRTLMVGDSMKTDVQFAANNGIDSLLVLTGSSTVEQLKKYVALAKGSQMSRAGLLPTYLLPELSLLADWL